MPENELPKHIDKFCNGWNRPRGDLCHWIPVLNYMDTILEKMVKKYELDQDEIVPKLFELEDERIVTSILNFSTFLLDKSSNRGIYNSESHVNSLVLSISPEVTSAALKLSGRLAERNVHSKVSRHTLPYVDTDRLLKFATCVTSRNGDRTSTADDTLIAYVNNTGVPSGFSLQYYQSELHPATKPSHKAPPTSQSQNAPESSSTTPQQSFNSIRKTASTSSLKSSDSRNLVTRDGLTEYKISTRDAIERPLDQVIGDAFKVVPRQYWLDVVIKAQIAKSTANTEEGARLRSLMLQMQCNALTVISTAITAGNIYETKIMNEYPSLIKQLSAILVPENPFDIHVRNAAIDAFCALCCQPAAIPEIMINLSSNVSYGTLMHVMRSILKETRSGKEHDDEYFFFIDGMISLSIQLLMTMQSNAIVSTTGGGMISLFWELVKEDKAVPRLRSNALDGLMRIISEIIPGYLNTFLQQESGGQVLMKILEQTVDIALDPTKSGTPPTLCSVDYSINYHTIQWLKVILHFIVSITTQARTADRIQQVLDSSFLSFAPKIISNPQIFGFRIISITLGIIGSLLENEASTFGIMTENHSIDKILAEVPSLLEFSSGLHGPVAKFLSSIAHNESGLALIKEKDIFNEYFKLVSKNLGEKDSLKHLGVCLDQICTEHASLRPIVIREAIKLIDIIIAKLNTYDSKLQFFYELDTTSESLEEDIPLAKRYSFLTSAVSFIDCLLKNHFSRVEFIKQRGVERILDILESPALSFDFAFNNPATSLNKTIKQLFDLDIDSAYVSGAILSKVSTIIDKAEAKAKLLPNLSEDLTEVDAYFDFLKSIGPVQNILQCFFFTVFTNYGTGYRISPVLRALSDEPIKKDDKDKDNDSDTPTFEHKDLIKRIGSIHRHILWESARLRHYISKEVADATAPLPYDPVLNSYFRRYQDSEDYKKIKDAEGKLPEEVLSSQRYRITKAARFILASSNSLVTENLVSITSFLTTYLPGRVSDKIAYKICDIITKSYYDHLLLFNERQSYDVITAWFAGFTLRSLEGVLSMSRNSISKLLFGTLIFFKQQGGIMLLADMAKTIFDNPLSDDKESPYSAALLQILLLFSMMTHWKPSSISDSDRSWGSSNPKLPNCFSPPLFSLEVSLSIFDAVTKIWESDTLETKSSFITTPIVLLLSNLFQTATEEYPAECTRKAPYYISWKEAPPSETMYNTIVDEFDIEEEDKESLREILEESLNNITEVSVEYKLEQEDVEKAVSEATYDGADRITVPLKDDGTPLMYPSDLKAMRESILNNAVDKVLGIVRVHPDIVFAACNFIYKIIPSSQSKTKSAVSQTKSSAIKELILMIISMDPTNSDDEKPLASFCHLLGLLLFDSPTLFDSLSDVLELAESFVDMLEIPGAVERDWFPYVLLILETVFAIKEIPDAIEKVQYMPKSLSALTDAIPKTDPLPKEIHDRVFKVLISADVYKDELVPVAISRLLVFFTRKHERASQLAQSPVLPKLLQQIKRFSIPPKEGEAESKLLVPKNPRFLKSLKEQLRTSLFCILRNAVETPEIVKNIMVTNIKQDLSNHKSQLEMFFQGKVMYAARSPSIFLETLAENCVVTDLNNLQKPQFITLREIVDKAYQKLEKTYEDLSTVLDKAIAENESTAEGATPLTKTDSKEPKDAESDVSMEDVEPEAPSQPAAEPSKSEKSSKPALSNIPGLTSAASSKSLTLENPSGIINILMHELLSIGRENMFTLPTKTPEALQAWVKENPKPEKSKDQKKGSENPHFHYACFLLQSIAELVSSYSACKLEFINFSKKPQTNASTTSVSSSTSLATATTGPVPFKPRYTALNYFLHELLPVGVLEPSYTVPMYEWNNISSLANLCIMTLLSSTDEKHYESVDEAQAEPTLLFVRKFTIDALAKAFREASQSANESLLWRYSKTSAFADLCNRLFSSGSSRSLISNSHYSVHSVGVSDGLAICKVAYDKGLPTVLTNSLAEIDLNYPLCKKPVRLLVRCLGKFSRLVIDVLDDGSAPEKPEEEDFFASLEELSSDSEMEDEASGIFRNSALSMFEAGDDLTDDGDEILVEDSDHESHIEEEVEEMDYIDDDAQSDVGSESSGIRDDEMFDQDMGSDSDLGSSADEDEELDDNDVDDEADDMEFIVHHNHNHSHGHNHNHSHNHNHNHSHNDGHYDEGDIEIVDELSMDDVQNAAANNSVRSPLSGDIIPAISGNNATNPVRARRGESDDGNGSVYENDSDWESFEEGDESEDEIERVETMLQQQDTNGVDDGDGSWIDDERDFEELINRHDNMFDHDNGFIYQNDFNETSRGADRHRTIHLNPLLAGTPDGYLDTRNILNPMFPAALQFLLRNPSDLRLDPVFGGGGDSKSLEVAAKRTNFRWGEAATLFWVFDKNTVVYRFVGHFINSVAEYSLERYAQLNALSSRVKKKEEEINLAYQEKARREKEQRDAKEREEQEEREKKEREEQERIDREKREQEEREERERQQNETEVSDEDNMETASVEMKDVDSADEAEEDHNGNEAGPSDRYMMTIGGHEVDISGLGIDHTFLEAIPEDMREEVLTQHLRGMQESASRGDTRVEELVSTFLNALPQNVRRELMNEEQEEPAATAGATETSEGAIVGDILDPATFFASLDPDLRRTLLLEQDDETLESLPAELAAEARMFRNRSFARPEIQNVPLLGESIRENLFQRIFHAQGESDPMSGFFRGTNFISPPSPVIEEKPKKKTISAASLHLVDKQGVAALLRTLYLPQTLPSDSLHELLYNLCMENKANRLDIINTVLHILMDASMDKATLDRGFLQTSNRARYAQTSNKSGMPITGMQGRVPAGYNVLAQEITPSVVAKQALEVLEYISHKGGPVRYFFVSEHDVPLTRRPSRKGKGTTKDKELAKEHKYPINILINLLGRPTIYENPITLEQLTIVLIEITKVIPVLLKTIDDDKKKVSEGDKPDSTQEAEAVSTTAAAAAPENDSATTAPEAATTDNDSSEPAKDDDKKSPKPHKRHNPPYIPEKNYKLISSTLVLKECSNRTFEHMVTIVKNLSSIPGVKDLFAKELVSLAVSFGPHIIENLAVLNKAVEETKPGDEVPGTILAPFSSGSSDQARLLRALAVLDYLLDHSKDKEKGSSGSKEVDSTDEDYINTVYKSMNFGPLWAALSESLTLIQDNPSLLYVATALLPLIEALMVICKNSAVKKISLRESNVTGTTSQFTPSAKTDISKAPLETLFFTFTDQHRKMLNQLVRANTKLMNGSFSILVKNPKSLEFDNKRRYFTKRLYDNGGFHGPQLNLNVQRDTTFLDSYRSLHFRSAEEIKRSRLVIKFKGEEGVDAGGLTREWYQVMSRQMFNPDYALFQPVASDRTTFHPNRTSSINDNHLFYFKFIGRIIGKAIYDNKLLDCHFSRAMYKRILGKHVSLKDMENLDPDYYKSLLWMLENDITDIITETFSIEADDYGETNVIDLKPDGHNIPVTEENKAEYVRLVCEYRLIESVSDQLDHFLEGFHDIIPKDIVSIFDEQELELLISGLPDIDIDDWRNNSEYQNYSPSSPQIKWFWRAVRSMDPEERAKLLQFVTGTSKVPLNGFKELVGMHGISKFSIHRAFGSKDRLPSSHTCFNQIDLPMYDSYENLREALLKAITEGSESFEIA